LQIVPLRVNSRTLPSVNKCQGSLWKRKRAATLRAPVYDDMHLVTVSIAMSVYPRLHTVANILIVSGLVAMVLMAIHAFVGREAAWITALTTLVFALVACFTPRSPV
jgi:hypothetical protein